MAIKDVIAAIRKEAGITQEEMARRLYVTRQCVSRWEQAETTPGIDMVKLICVTFGVPLERFFDMPMSYYCQCCSMPIPDEEMHGTEARRLQERGLLQVLLRPWRLHRQGHDDG